ncbi:hypothetical protein AUEXF2481DRAFT_177316 [Aureobasidium subglaciale EXF-2481]|uniref:Cytochrome b5 heme-binding domain-containing protein n=1 Tax=Aureobasidium subglaciale (strain EXF-2481) TaxID=1043005 RepID=A0A074YP31_AURSE|nr:uncharacterized protein AUEXF2481DRAFT_177316 [Aureobasidium subglaciale EXF-2481]KEQ99450.1 hypothetical protein AUEXF2481DRAFT_177316 [Aureobasidium subglaciale EXF-2481]
MSQSLTAKEVKDHASPDNGLYIIIDNAVYSMQEFADEHPGGSKILKRVGGKGMSSLILFLTHRFIEMSKVLMRWGNTDASKQFWKYHNEHVLKKYQKRLKIGELKEEAKL